MPKHLVKYGLAAVLALSGLSVGGAEAAVAAPILAHPATVDSTAVTPARLVCGPYRCFRRPGRFFRPRRRFCRIAIRPTPFGYRRVRVCRVF